jgi:7-carboxy-7-deazaguanine synthase
MQIIEIYKSLQGESSYAGLPCVFVRLAGCNLRCTWCDSEYTFNGGTRMALDEVQREVHRLSPSGGLVEITGGEPMLQERDVVPLMQALFVDGYTVLLETSGERPLETVPREVIKIVDVKCPDSGEPDTFEMRNLEALSQNDEIKFVLSTRRDYEFAREFTLQHNLRERVHQVLFSPVFEGPDGKWPALEARNVVEWMLEDSLPVRLGLQLHKFVWDPATKGV